MKLLQLVLKTLCVGKPSKTVLLLWEMELVAAQLKLTELTVIKFYLILRPNLYQGLVCIPYKKIGF